MATIARDETRARKSPEAVFCALTREIEALQQNNRFYQVSKQHLRSRETVDAPKPRPITRLTTVLTCPRCKCRFRALPPVDAYLPYCCERCHFGTNAWQ